ncbi:hypothetical protein [Scytonema sp. PCC 10023]|uniref:hypothetical protein n=1 Tax=Scytonema sp. PCC 10023 TaxID=1680591 RepID=UPI0039C66B7F
MLLQKLSAITIVVGLGFFISRNPAEAAVFDFSYEFLTGNTISGSVEGDLQSDGDTVQNLRNLSARYSAEPTINLNFIHNSRISFSGNVFNLTGFQNDPNIPSATPFGGNDNFGFILSNSYQTNGVLAPNSATVGIFATGNGFGFPFGSRQREAEALSVTRWSLSQRSVSAPEPHMIGGMLAVGLFSVVLKRFSSARL